MKNSAISIIFICICCILFFAGCADIARKEQDISKVSVIPDEAKECINCHERKAISSIALRDWRFSTHAENGVTCIDCHIPAPEASTNIKNGTTLCDNKSVRRFVAAENCEQCHSEQTKQFDLGKHAKAWRSIQNLANSSRLSSSFNTEESCSACHRIGRDHGKCDSCHTRHRFTASEARKPEACQTCHMGTAHPQWETYSTSKHGSIYSIEGQNWFWNKRISEWYKTPLIDSPVIHRAPVCVSCHMSEGNHAIDTSGSLGDIVGSIEDIKEIVKDNKLSNSQCQKEREKMIKVCSQCDTTSFSKDVLRKADNTIKECNKLMNNAINIVEGLYKDGIIQKGKNVYPHIDVLRFSEFENPIEKYLYKMFAEHRVKAFMGAFHINPTYQYDYGLAEMKRDLDEIENLANSLRKEGSEK